MRKLERGGAITYYIYDFFFLLAPFLGASTSSPTHGMKHTRVPDDEVQPEEPRPARLGCMHQFLYVLLTLVVISIVLRLLPPQEERYEEVAQHAP